MAGRIVEQIENIPHSVYVEPFAGGASVLFEKPKWDTGNIAHYIEVLNDTNDLLITMYRVAVENADALQLEIDATLYSQSDYERAMEIYKAPADRDELTIAWAVYVNAQLSFANKMNAGWRTSVFSRNQAATWNNQKQRLPHILRRLAAVYISSEDALRCIERWDSPQTLFYIDPPYPGAHQGHYSGYTLDDWSALCELLDNIKGSYILSNYGQDVEPRSAQERIEIDAVSSAAKNKDGMNKVKRTEILWTCDRSRDIKKKGVLHYIERLTPVVGKNWIGHVRGEIDLREKPEQLDMLDKENVNE